MLIGTPVIPIPTHPRIHHLGYVTDQDKFDAIAASELLIMPSYFESLSMVALEAWALGQAGACQRRLRRPARSVPAQQCGALLQRLQEFFETLRTIDGNTGPGSGARPNGRQYFQRTTAGR